MDMVTLSLFAFAETALLLGILVFVLWLKNSNLRRQVSALTAREESASERFESIESGYLPFLEQQIIDTRARLELSETETGSDQDLTEALNARIALLESEKKVTELCNDYPKARWEHVLAQYRAEPEPDENGAGAPDPDSEAADCDQLELAQQRIRSLEIFRDHFFEMKRHFTELEAAKNALAERLEALLPEAERSQELQKLLDELNRQKDKLQDKVGQLEAQADELSSGDQPAAGDRVLSEVERVSQLNGMLGEQRTVITSMKNVLEQVKEDPQRELIEQLEKQLLTLERRYQEASTCVQIMEQENERLQKELEQGEQRARKAEAEQNESLVDLQEQIGKQKSSITDLNDVISGLQLEAGKAAELQAKLDQFELTSRDMNMCVQVLEEENQFLQEQVKALLQLDEDQSVYDADAKGESDRVDELQQQVDSLKAELVEKENQIKQVEARFAAMEKEYLTLYEEVNS